MEFEDPQLLNGLERMNDGELDHLAFGVIGFDARTQVCRYNAFESRAAGIQRVDVLGHSVFVEVAQCMNNYLVALRFEDAAAERKALDAIVPYVLTWRMKPTRVRLRLLYDPGIATRYIAIDRI